MNKWLLSIFSGGKAVMRYRFVDKPSITRFEYGGIAFTFTEKLAGESETYFVETNLPYILQEISPNTNPERIYQ